MLRWWYNISIRVKKKYTIKLNPQKLGLIVLGVFLLLISYLYIDAKESENAISKSSTQTPILELTPSPTPTQEVTAPVVKKYTPTIDPDPPVHCNIHANCGGGTKPLKQSECNNSICCQIGNKWIFYIDKNKCLADQGQASELQPKTENIPATAGFDFPVYLTGYSSTVYCKFVGVDAVKTADLSFSNAKTEWKNCMQRAASSQSKCESNCNSSSDYQSCYNLCKSFYEIESGDCEKIYKTGQEGLDSLLKQYCVWRKL